jgi:hypothetical protein
MSIARAPQSQATLITIPPIYRLGSNALARNAYGSAVEEIVCAAMHMRRIPIDGSKSICFDAEWNDAFVEIKSLHKGASFNVYKWRLEKEMAQAAKGTRIYYAILFHGVRKHTDGGTLLRAFAKASPELLIIPVQAVAFATLGLTPHVPKPPRTESRRNGYNRAGYKLGYYKVPLDWAARLPNMRRIEAQ